MSLNVFLCFFKYTDDVCCLRGNHFCGTNSYSLCVRTTFLESTVAWGVCLLATVLTTTRKVELGEL